MIRQRAPGCEQTRPGKAINASNHPKGPRPVALVQMLKIVQGGASGRDKVIRGFAPVKRVR